MILGPLRAAVPVLLLLVAPAPGGAAPAAACAPAPAAVAHRGGTESALENTLGAFRAAGDAGVLRWELDVRFDSEGTPVVLHDATVDRVSPRSGAITGLDATNTRIPTDDGQWIPTLRAALSEAERSGATVLTELKVMPAAEQWQAVVADIDATVGRDAVVLMSFDKQVVAEARERVPGAATGVLQSAGYLSPEQIGVFGSAIMQNYRTVTASRVRSWHEGGISAYAWTVNDATGWSAMLTAGVDAVITDRPNAFRAWADGQCPSAGFRGWQRNVGP